MMQVFSRSSSIFENILNCMVFLLLSISSAFAVPVDSSETVPANIDNTSKLIDSSDPLNSVLLNFDLPENTHLLILFAGVLTAILLGTIFYRALLKNQVTQGVHPREFFATVVFTVIGFFLLSMFYVLLGNSSTAPLGWFTILAGAYLFFLTIFLIMGRVRKWILIILVLIGLIIAFQLANMNNM